MNAGEVTRWSREMHGARKSVRLAPHFIGLLYVAGALLFLGSVSLVTKQAMHILSIRDCSSVK